MKTKFINMVGEKFGKLEVVSYGGKDANEHTLWICKCECGRLTTVPRGNLIAHNTRSCGCARFNMADKSPPGMNRIGERHAALTIIARGPDLSSHRYILACKCDCGNVVEMASNYFRLRTDCGCGMAGRSKQKYWRPKDKPQTKAPRIRSDTVKQDPIEAIAERRKMIVARDAERAKRRAAKAKVEFPEVTE
jgi:hypothetical protein